MTAIRDWIEEQSEPVLTLPADYDAAVSGIVHDRLAVVYDAARVLQIVIEGSQNRMGREEAIEHFDFNLVGSFAGREGAPVFVWPVE